MKTTIWRFWKANKLLTLTFALAFGATVFFGVRTAMFTIYWNDPAHKNQAVAGWMTPRYVAHSWRVPPKLIVDALGYSPEGPRERITISEISKTQNVDIDTLIKLVEAAIDIHNKAMPENLYE